MKTLGKKFFAILSAVMLLAFAGCVKNEFSISFEFPKDFVGNYIVTFYAWNSRGGTWLETTASVQEGRAEVKGVTHNPTLVYLRDASSPSNSITFYAERGDKIVISGDSPDMNTWSVSGNDTSEEWQKWRCGSAGKDKEKAISAFVKENPDEELSTLLMLTEWDRAGNPDGFVKLWNSIKESARPQQLIEMCGCPDFPGVGFTVAADGSLRRAKDTRLRSLAVRSRDNGLDTLNLARVKASILFFFEDYSQEKQTAIDSLKSLARQYPDSTGRIISDISLDSDSAAWISATRRDTIAGAVRGWLPHGPADRNAVRLGIGRLPWLVVTGKNAREVYSGADVTAAVKAFRKEMDRKETDKKDNAKKSSR